VIIIIIITITAELGRKRLNFVLRKLLKVLKLRVKVVCRPGEGLFTTFTSDFSNLRNFSITKFRRFLPDRIKNLSYLGQKTGLFCTTLTITTTLLGSNISPKIKLLKVYQIHDINNKI
jgi:hypothetical protein